MENENNHVFMSIILVNFLLTYRNFCKHPKTNLMFKLLKWLLVLFLITLTIIFIGAKIERREVDAAPSTSKFYDTKEICAVNVDSNSSSVSLNSTFVTYPDIETVQEEDDVVVAHCGECGECSSIHDIQRYKDTKNTLTDLTKTCAVKALLFGRSRAQTCMQKNVGLSPGCDECWLDNIMCDVNRCVFSCAWGLFSLRDNNKSRGQDQDLNACLTCDEKLCGPEFIQCAGANRRRSGILSDIGRDSNIEVCHSVDGDWLEPPD